ncbi:hypothetical protein K0M31_000492 [Melipona bicolor]|uniref:Uncharacterized protein n=1 Tax=Melipona bicolor TaxID=60889 RepID=A0AA40KWW3_9HYME|nr:hypothetical protein K0M31_000492 [Melipona bicolor]
MKPNDNLPWRQSSTNSATPPLDTGRHAAFRRVARGGRQQLSDDARVSCTPNKQINIARLAGAEPPVVAPYPSTSGYIARDELQTTKKETPWGGLRAGRVEAREAVSRCSRSRAGLFRRMRSIPKRPRHRIPVGFYGTAPLTVPVSINLGQSPRKTDLKIPCSVRFIPRFIDLSRSLISPSKMVVTEFATLSSHYDRREIIELLKISQRYR